MVIQNTSEAIDSLVIINEEIVTKKVFDRILSQQYNAFKEKANKI